ncbi:MAG: NAD(P)H-hydrate dehydratase [Firmicutes bacterium]|nr:NAD(P)H-hydrate dehydratase [Bacillota bacterium]
MSESIITLKTVKNIIERRNREIHKGDCGRILIAAGSVGMAGAAVLAARGALRAGSGLVQLAVPEEIFPIVQAGVLEATCLSDDLDAIDWGRYDAAALGPGLGTGLASVEKVKTILKKYDGPLVIDADGLNILAEMQYSGVDMGDGLTAFDIIRQRNRKDGGSRTIITPHMGEARRLLGGDYDRICRLMGDDYDAETIRVEMALLLTRKTGAITVLKGAGTVVATPEGQTYTNTTGNPGMATAGSGDVLTGIITALLGQKKTSGVKIVATEAALAGVYVHGLAGDLGAADKGEYGLIAGDIAEYTAYALKKISEES